MVIIYYFVVLCNETNYNKMTSEEIKAIVYYIQGLQALWKEGYNAEKVGDYTSILYVETSETIIPQMSCGRLSMSYCLWEKEKNGKKPKKK